MEKISIRDFLVERDKTGRFIVVSNKTGKTYYVEPIGNYNIKWGDLNPTTGKVEGEYGDKYPGSIHERDSLIDKHYDQFDKVYTLGVGQDPLSFIENLENKVNKEN